MSANILNAYLQAPTSQRLWTKLGPEFGSDSGKKAIIQRALYGNKAAGRDFQNNLRSCMEHLGYKPCYADPDVWMRKSKYSTKEEYYWEYVLLYVDDALCISEFPKAALQEIGKYFTLKPDCIECPKLYLGAKMGYNI